MVEVRSNGSLLVSVDPLALEQITGRLNECKRNQEEFDDQIQELNNQVTRQCRSCTCDVVYTLQHFQIMQLSERKEKLSNAMQTLRNSKVQMGVIDGKIKTMTEKIEHLQQDSMTEEDIRKETCKKIQVVFAFILGTQR